MNMGHTLLFIKHGSVKICLLYIIPFLFTVKRIFLKKGSMFMELEEDTKKKYL